MVVNLNAWIAVASMLLLATTHRQSTVAAAPIPTAGPSLTQDTWNMVNKGTWPYCPHCRSFAPTWKEFVDKRQDDAAEHDFHFAQVDCAANGDLCRQNGVKYYPTLFLYVDGERKDEYTGKRTVDSLSLYVDDHLPKTIINMDKDGQVKIQDEDDKVKGDAEVDPEPTKQGDQDDDYEDALHAAERGAADPGSDEEHRLAAIVNETSSDDDDESDDAKSVKQDSKVDERPVLEREKQPAGPGFVQQIRKEATGKNEAKRTELPKPDGQVHLLKPSELALLKEQDGQAAFVKFYAPWCGHCKALAPKWADMATSLAGNVHVYEVDCDDADNKRMCRDEGIKAFPTLIFYHKGSSVEYHGKRDVATMKNFALKAVSATSIKPIANEYELKRAAAEEDVIILFLHSSDTSKEDKDLATSAAKTLLGGAPFYTSTSLDLYHLFNLPPLKPYLLSFKDGSVTPVDLLSLDQNDLQAQIVASSKTMKGDKASNSKEVNNPVQARFDLTKQWLRSAKLPTLTELSGSTFNDLMPKEGDPPLVALAILSRKGLSKPHEFDQAREKMLSLAQQWKSRRTAQRKETIVGDQLGREVVWSWVDGDRWAGWIRKMYDVKMGGIQGPEIVIADPKAMTYWKTSTSGSPLSFEASDVFNLIEQGIYSGSVKPASSLSTIDKLSSQVANLPKSSLSQASQHPILTGLVVLLSWILVWSCCKKCCSSSRTSDENGYARVNNYAKND
ncbi:hypothetical protein OIO90_004336 [Microbotryomycetes sp. JL221]|nr:hypothetical protein OIO90_004336 [Microbotryomycetes sp. JL221]